MKMKFKKFFAGMLSGVMVITAVPLGSFSEAELPSLSGIISPLSELFDTVRVWAASSTYGDFTYTLDKEDNAVITQYDGTPGSDTVKIPSEIEGHSVTEIGKLAFKNCEGLESIDIPDSVIAIGYDAFSGCTNLKTVRLSSNLESLGSGAFYKCEMLENIELPDTLTVFGADSFSGCTCLKSITIPPKAAEFPGNGHTGWCFKDCTGLESAAVNNGIIPNGMFNGCTGLKEITINGDVEKICVRAFENCESLESIVLPDSLTEIEYQAFQYCGALKSVKLGDNVNSIGYAAFNQCEMLEDITFPDTLTVLGADSFDGCTSLKSITIPEKVSEFPGNGSTGHVFQDSGLESVVVKNGIIPKRMFYNCKNLKDVSIEGAVADILTQAFAYCESLENIDIPDSVNTIDYEAFQGCTALESVRLSENIECISEGLFYGCESLESIYIPDSVTLFDDKAFEGCKSLADVRISPNVTDIGKYAFEGCESLESIVIPDKVEAIPFNAFVDCENLRDIHIGKGVKEIDSQSFWNCRKLKTVRIDGDVDTIADNAFHGCDSLEYISVAYENSASVISVIDMEIPYTADVTGIIDSEEKALDISKCGYHSSSASVPASGIVGMEINYAFKSAAENSVSDMSVSFKLPSDTSIVEGTLKANGADVKYDLNKKKNIVTVPVTSKSGTVKFSISGASDASYLVSYAQMNYTAGGEEKTETIGIVNILENLITLSVPSSTSKDVLTVKGMAAPNKKVTIYVDGNRAEVCTAAAAGRYSAEIALPDAENGKTYKIEAEAEKNDKIVSGYVTYDKNCVELTRFDMYFDGNKYDLIELDGRRPVLSWNKRKTFSFSLSFNDNSRVDNVKVVSTRNGEIRKADAVYDSVNDCFVTGASFKEYLVGTFTVEYDLVPDFAPVEGTEKVWQGSYTIGKCSGSVTKLRFPGGEDSLYYFEENETGVEMPSSDMYTYRNNGNTYYMSKSDVWFYRDNGVFIGREFYVQNYNGTCDVYRYGIGMTADSSDIKAFTEKAVFICNDTDVLDILKARFSGAGRDEYYETALKIKELLEKKFIYPDDPLVKKLMELIEKGIDDADKLKKLIDEYEKNRRGYLRHIYIRRPVETAPPVTDRPYESETTNTTTETTAPETDINTVTTEVTSEIIECPGPYAPVGYIEYIIFIVEKIRDCCPVGTGAISGCPVGGGCVCDIYVTFKIIIDPSGNVYEGVMSNRVPDAEARIYYKDDSGNAVLWDAEEYDQHNPLYSDSTGYYAWDVPEGMWQVEVSKEGYEKAYSDWLPVPPEQLEVHIGMISENTPKVDFVAAYPKHIDVRFDQYADISKVSGDNMIFEMNSKKISGKIEPVDAEESPSDSSLMLARTFRLTADDTLSGEISYAVSGIVNYAGKAMSDEFTGKVSVTEEITGFETEDTAYVTYTNEKSVKIKAVPAKAAAGKKLILNAGDECIISVPESVSFNEEGIAEIPVKALLPGETFITYSVEGSVFEGTLNIASEIDLRSLNKLSAETQPPETTAPATTETTVSKPADTETSSESTAETTEITVTTLPAATDGTENTGSETTTQPQFMPGDVSGNKKVDLKDAIMIAKYKIGKIKFDAAQKAAADFNNDKRVNIGDIIAIAKFVMEKV